MKTKKTVKYPVPIPEERQPTTTPDDQVSEWLERLAVMNSSKGTVKSEPAIHTVFAEAVDSRA